MAPPTFRMYLPPICLPTCHSSQPTLVQKTQKYTWPIKLITKIYHYTRFCWFSKTPLLESSLHVFLVLLLRMREQMCVQPRSVDNSTETSNLEFVTEPSDTSIPLEGIFSLYWLPSPAPFLCWALALSTYWQQNRQATGVGTGLLNTHFSLSSPCCSKLTSL